MWEKLKFVGHVFRNCFSHLAGYPKILLFVKFYFFIQQIEICWEGHLVEELKHPNVRFPTVNSRKRMVAI